MHSLELARAFHADREREIREHVRVTGLLRAARANREHADTSVTPRPLRTWPAADGVTRANGGAR